MGDNLEAQGWTAFVGGTLFEIGGYMMVLESLNRKHEVCSLSIFANRRYVSVMQYVECCRNVHTTSTIESNSMIRMSQRYMSRNGSGMVLAGTKSASLLLQYNSLQLLFSGSVQLPEYQG